MIKNINFLFVTFFGIGTIRYAPGTISSLITTILLFSFFHILNFSNIIILTMFLTIFFYSFFAIESYIKDEFNKDPKEIVIDEWVGMWISLYLVPHTIVWGFIAFFFFRLFDILKPGPVQMMDDMDDSIGVMMDDVVAGILACLVTQSLLYFNQ